MIVWGGDGNGTPFGAPAFRGDGAAYDPGTNTWRQLPTENAPSPRESAHAVWTGREMLIWGGYDKHGTVATGARYDPETNTWRAINASNAPASDGPIVWTSREMVVTGGSSTSGVLAGGRYDPSADTWTTLPTAGAPSRRANYAAVWAESQMLIWGGIGANAVLFNTGAAYTPPTPTIPHDARYFAQTGYRIDNDTIWNYFQRRGGIPTFGYPTSRTFLFQGFTVQFFQRRIVQLDQNGNARLLNLLDPGLLNYTAFNGSTFPGVDSSLVSTAPDPTNQPAVLAWVQQHAPDTVGSNAVNFFHTFSTTVSAQTAFPNGGDRGALWALLPGIELEIWGVPTSGAFTDPNNHNFIYLRWQRGIMMYDASTGLTQGILLADYLKAIITGQHLPADVSQEAQGSPFLGQYDPSQPNWVHNQSLLPNTNFTNAFTQE